MPEVIPWETKLQGEGAEIFKFYFSKSKTQQAKRIKARKYSELKYWKFSSFDEYMVSKWANLTLYKDQMFKSTATKSSPRIIINANKKMIARLTDLGFL